MKKNTDKHYDQLFSYLVAKYGVRLSINNLVDICNMSAGSIRNAISEERFPIKTYKEGKQRYADCRDVIEYLDEARKAAE